MKTRLLPLLAALTLAAAPSRAQLFTWTGTDPAESDWSNPSNWDGGALPAATGSASIQNGHGPVVSGTTLVNLSGLYVGSTAASSGSLTLADSGTLIVAGPTQMAYVATSTATLNLSGNSYLGGGDMYLGFAAGSLFNATLADNARFNAGGVLYLGYGGTSTINVAAAGSLNAGTLDLGRTVGSLGVINVAGSGTLSTVTANIGFYRGSGVVTLADNAVMTVAAAMNLGMTNGDNNVTGASGRIHLTGSAQLDVKGAMSVGNYTRGELHVSDNATATAGNIMIGTLQGNNVNMKGNGLIVLNGDSVAGRGTLSTSSITRGVGGSGTLQFDGGILRATGDNTAFLGSSGTHTLTVYLDDEGGYIDSGVHNIGIASTVAITGAGAFNKLGAGTLTLDAATAHTGATNIGEGILALTASGQLLSSGAINIAANATLSSPDIAQTLHNLSGDGAIQMENAALTINNTGDTVFNGSIIAIGGLVKNGGGALTLGGDNILGAHSTHSEGILGIAGDLALGDSALAISNAAVLRADADVTIANAIAVTGGPLALDTLGAARMIVAGVVTGSQGIVKNGAGSIVFSNDTTALGGTVDVNQGGLLVAGLGATTVTVADGADFGGSGIINGDISYSGSGALQIGATHNDSIVVAPSTLTVAGGLALGDTLIKIDTYGGNASDKLVAGDITLGGQTDIDFSMIRQGAFTLIETTSGTLDATLPSTINTYRNGTGKSTRETLAYDISPDGKTLSVTITKNNEAITWTGGAGDTWDYNHTASWVGDAPTFIDGDRVIFDLAGSGTIAIDASSVTASDMSVTGNGSHTFTGAGRITTDATSVGTQGAGFGGAPGGKFTMQGTGTVTFENASNVFLSGIDILQGVVVGNARNLAVGAGASIDNSGTLVFDQNTNATYASPLMGAGAYVKTGSSNLLLTSPDSAPSGSVTVSEGGLLLSETARLGSAAIFIEDTALFGGSGTAAAATLRGGGILQTGLAVAGPQVGAETLRLSALTIENTGRLTGSGTLSAPVTIAPAATAIADIAASRTLVIDGPVQGDGSLAKEGAGNLVLTSQASYTGATTITGGTLSASGPNVFSANSTHIIKPGGVLNLAGYDQTLGSIINEGVFAIGQPGAAGARLTLTNGYIGAGGSIITFNVRAADGSPSVADRLIIAGGGISGTTTVRVNVYDQRANPAAPDSYLNDIPSLIINEAGALPADVFRLDGGRVVIGLYDYHLYNAAGEARLVAVDSAEIPAVLTINPLGIAVNRATLNALGQRLDHLRDAIPGENETYPPFNLWLQGYYRRDRFYNEYWANTRGAQIGADYRDDLARGGTAVYGLFADTTVSEIDLHTFNNPRTSLDSKSLGAYLAIHIDNWCTDIAFKHSWDKYTIKLADTPGFDIDGSSWAGMLRVSYLIRLQSSWTIVPQVQMLFQSRGLQDTSDTYGRQYVFGQKYTRITETNSLEGRAGVSARKLITLKSGKTLLPYISLAWLNDFHGDMTLTTVNEKQFTDDLGGGSFQINLGIHAQISKRLTAFADAALQNGGKIDSYSVNAGINCRW